MGVAIDQSSFVVVVTPQESFGTAPSRSLHELRVVGWLDLFDCAAKHGEDGEADGTDSQGGRPLKIMNEVQS
jgi:hypothetical protein